MEYINVKAMADGIIDQVAAIPNKSKSLCIISVGDNEASKAYMRGKIKDCERCGIPHVEYHFDSFPGVGLALEMAIRSSNEDDDIGGIILQLPLPRDNFSPSDEDYYTRMIDPRKDVDGFQPNSPFHPCTPEGIVHIMHRELGDDLSGKTALIIGRGKLVGRPLYELLQYQENMEVMQLNSYEKYIHFITNDSPGGVMWDCIITATGQPKLLDVCRCNTNLIIDAGITRGADGKLCGDCYNFEDLGYVEEFYAGYNPSITTVPGGVGLMTRAMLMKHMGEVQ